MNQVALQRPVTLKSRLSDYVQLTKFKLAMLVVFSAAMGFMSAPGAVNWQQLLVLTIGGFLVTGGSNGLNQVMERDLDKKMDRTRMRPLPDQRLTIGEATLLSLVAGITGVMMLAYGINMKAGLLGLFALVSYAFIYTPLKRKTPFCVFVGAIPGAIPPMLGWVAATGHFGIEAWVLFSIQFIWQFPHFWAIAWVLDDDYKRAGFVMLPTGKRDKGSAMQAFIYTVSLLPIGFMPFVYSLSGLTSAVVITITTLYFIKCAYALFRFQSVEMARKLMFASFIYLPVVQLIIMLNKN
ncbi:MAG: heme o synthase [Bacteroidota bacterium]